MNSHTDNHSAVNGENIIALGGFPIKRTTKEGLTNELEKTVEQGRQVALFFANTNFVVKCQEYKEKMADTNTIIINDGVGLDIATWLVHRKKFPENLNGTDFIPAFLQSLKTTGRVFLLGAKPGIAQRAAQTLWNQFQVNVVGVLNGYDQAKDTAAVIEKINQSNANIVLVAMGNPYQEEWIMKNRAQLNVSVLIGVGALFDFLAGEKARAPEYVQRMRLEWLYRLSLEPSRLLRRYTIDIGQFLILCLRKGSSLGNSQ